MNKKPRCHNCKFSGPQFKIGKLTHLHCVSPVMETYFKEYESPSFWHSLRVFNDSCNDHEFKQIDLKNTDCKPFYMVFVEDSVYPPKLKHEKYEDAFQEMLRLSKKENKKAYVLLSVTQVEQIPNVKQFSL